MNMRNRLLAVVLSLVIAAAAVCGCAADTSTSASEEAVQSTAQESASPSAEPSASEELSDDAQATVLDASGDASDGLSLQRSITDMAGRSVDIPEEINKVYATSPVGSIFVYTLAPEKLLGWNYAFNDWEKKYIEAQYQDLPVYGMNDSLNLEALIEAKPDVILQVAGLGDSAKEQADSLSSQTGIPVLMYSLNLTDTALVYEQLGILLDVQDRAAQLAEYSGAVMTQAREKAETVPEDQRVTVYYGNGPSSLNTAPQGSDAMEVIEMAGGVNCAALELQSGDGATERIDISPEQLLAWNPDIIFVNGEPKEDLSAQAAADAILADATYASLQAVADGRVYGIPQTPFSWLDRPKGPNRIIGITWAGALMYPDLYTDTDLAKEIQDFYSLFYHVDLTPEDVAQLPSE